MAPVLLLLAASLAASGGCAKDDPLFCAADQMCLEGYPYCDLEGICPASGFHGNTCIPEACWDAGPNDVDAGSTIDAGVEPDAATLDPAMLAVTPDMQEWGSVVVDQQSQITTFTVSNIGGNTSGTLTVALSGAHADQFTIVNQTCDGQSLSASTDCDVLVRFTPTSATVMNKTASLDVSATPGGSVSAPLSGVALAPGDLSIDPTNEDFGTIDVGSSSSSTTFTVTNTGGSPTGTLSSLLSNNLHFDIVGDTCNATALGAGGMCTVQVQASPNAIAGHVASLTVSANPGGNAAASLSTTGAVDLVVTVAGAGNVTSMPAGIDCTVSNSPCTTTHESATLLTLIARPEPHTHFVGWSGGGCSGLGDCVVTVNAAMNITATFAMESIASGGSGHACAVVPVSRAVRCWGYNNFGQLGVGNTAVYGDNEPASASGQAIASNVVQIVAGTSHSCALLSDQTVRCWGYANRGRLGYGDGNEHIGDNTNESVGGIVQIGTAVRQLAAGADHTCALLDNGGVRCWGHGGSGRLGQGSTENLADTPATIPMNIPSLPLPGLAVQVAAGTAHTCALLANGTVHCWGLGNSGQLGYGNENSIGSSPSTTLDNYGPVNVGGSVMQIAATGSHTCALLTTGDVRCWGIGASGRLGLGNTNNIGEMEEPAQVDPINVGGTVRQISTGNGITCALLDTGDVKCWGANSSGQLGLGHTNSIGDNINEMPPATVNVGGAVVEISGGYVTCARMATGAVRCWGSDLVGTLGYGSPEENIGDNEDPASAGDVPYIP